MTSTIDIRHQRIHKISKAILRKQSLAMININLSSPAPTDTVPVLIWWASLTILAIINTHLLRSAYTTLASRRASYPPWLRDVRSRQFIMSTIYVGGCAFRSILPCHHTLRRALVGCYASTGFVGRCVATIAELGAADQAGLLLREIGIATNDGVVTSLSYAMVPLLVSAELFSWYACVTTNYLGSIVEESLWAMCAFLSIVAFLRCYNEYVGREQRDFIHKAVSDFFELTLSL
jgi:hypothetical protein